MKKILIIPLMLLPFILFAQDEPSGPPDSLLGEAQELIDAPESQAQDAEDSIDAPESGEEDAADQIDNPQTGEEEPQTPGEEPGEMEEGEKSSAETETEEEPGKEGFFNRVSDLFNGEEEPEESEDVRKLSENISIVLSTLRSSDPDTRRRTEMYTEELKTALVELSRFDIITSTENVESGEELTKEQAIVLGQEKLSDFVLYGTVTENERSITFYLYMVSPQTGMDVLAETRKTSQEMYVFDLKRLALQIEQATIIASEEALDYVRTYMDYENWERAYEVMQNYIKLIEISGDYLNSEETEMKDTIEHNLAQLFSDQAQRFLDAQLYLEAQVRNKKALDFEPENELFVAQQLEIERSLSLFREEEMKASLQTVRNLISREDFVTASVILEGVENTGEDSVEISSLRTLINNKLDSLDHYEQALKSYRQNEMNTARFHIEAARQLDSGNPSILSLQQDIYRRSQALEKDDQLWQSYEKEVEGINSFNLFLKSKKPLHLETISYNYSDVIWQESSGSSLSEKNKVLNGIELNETWLFKNPFPFLDLSLDSASLRPYASGSLSAGFRESNFAVQQGAVNGFGTDSDALYMLSAGGGLNLQILSFALFGGIHSGMGLWNERSREVYTTDSSLDSKDSSLLFVGHTGGELGLAWYPTEKLQLALVLRRSFFFKEGLMDSRLNQVTLGLGFRMY